MSYTVCNGVTQHVTNAVRTSVQNQNQNQRFWLLLLVVFSGMNLHASLQSVRGRILATQTRPMDATTGIRGGL